MWTLFTLIVLIGTVGLSHAKATCVGVLIETDQGMIEGVNIADSRGRIYIEGPEDDYQCHVYKDDRYTEWWGTLHWTKEHKVETVALELVEAK